MADGVYTEEQAARGAAVYDTECSGCHRGDLGGGTGPPLKEQRFARIFAGKDLKTLFTKIATTMPRNAPASLGDNVYLDVVAHVLKENGFPAGPQELAADALEGIGVVPGRPKPPPRRAPRTGSSLARSFAIFIRNISKLISAAMRNGSLRRRRR